MNEALKMARGEKKAPLVLKNGLVLNVFTNEWLKKDIAIYNKTIIGVGEYEGEVEYDLSKKFVIPGLIDAHMHLESSMVTPIHLSKMLLEKGTTTIIADPHELVNVKGKLAMDYLLEASETCPLELYFALPSSVPATDFETNGCGEFSAEMMQTYLSHPRIISLGETMRFYDVIMGEEKMSKKLALFKDKVIDGHAPNLSGKNLEAYRLAGVGNDHECVSFEEALEMLRSGFHIFVREGSGARNVEKIISGFVAHGVSLDRVMFCTDDKHLEDIRQEGHISFNVKKAIALGVSEAQAIKMASLQPALVYGLKKKGAIAAGYDADLLILDDVKEMAILKTMKLGKWLEEYEFTDKVMPNESLLHSVILPDLALSDFSLKKEEQNVVIELVPYELLSKLKKEVVPGKDEFIPNAIYNKLCVIERHGHHGRVGLGILKGFGLKKGAIATTVAHDSHNVIACGVSDEDLLLAVNTLKEIQGGYVLVSEGKVLESLPLPLCGLMSLDSSEVVEHKVEKMIRLARSLGVAESVDPFITLSFLALPVIPEIRLTDKGLYDVINGKFLT